MPGQTDIPSIAMFTLGPYETNCFVISPKAPTNGESASQPCWIVDASFNPAPMLRHVVQHGLQPQALILTHAHIDHIAGAWEVRKAFPTIPVWIHADERDWLSDPVLNLSEFSGNPVTGPTADRLLADSDVLTLGSTAWRVLHTPGHSPGGIALVHDASHTAIVGDALFAGSIGRTDFPGSSPAQLTESIRSKLYTLPGQTKIHPGHGPTSTIEVERRTNPFVRPLELR